MSRRPIVALYHDTRRILDNGKFPVRVRVTFHVGNKWVQRYYTTGQVLSRAEWDQVQRGAVRGDLRRIRAMILDKEKEANDIIHDAPFISVETFEAIFTGKRTRSAMLRPLFEEVINQMQESDRISSAHLYRNALDAIVEYAGEGITLNVIDVDFLSQFESWMKGKGRSVSTIGFYLRNLRAVFNIAIDRKIIPADLYPFGRRKYVIPTSRNVKKALSVADKEKLISDKPIKPREKRALDDWKFSYFCNGMNFADMAYLKKSNIQGDLLVYVRKKSSTTEREQKPQIVTLLPEILKFLKNLPDDREYIFGIIEPGDDATTRKAKIREWVTQTNRKLEEICKRLEIPRVTTYTARHTAATMLLRAGANPMYIKTALGHSSVAVTENYLSSLDLDEQRALTSKL
jgi:integrase/recombinase XerD